MTRTVVVAVGIGRSWEALSWAAEEVAAGGDRLVVCHVSPPGLAEPPRLIELSHPRLGRTLATLRARLGEDRVELSVPAGAPATALIGVAMDADLLVIGTDGDSSRAGPITRHVLHHAPCPVVVVRPAGGGGAAPFAGHVVVGVQGHRAEDRAVGLAFGFADRYRCPLVAVHVAGHHDDDYWYDDETLSTHFVAEPADLDLLAVAVEPWHHRYRQVPVKRAVVGGPVVQGLLRAAVGARLLVLGRGTRSSIRHAVLGDIDLDLVNGARCTVAVVPGGGGVVTGPSSASRRRATTQGNEVGR